MTDINKLFTKRLLNEIVYLKFNNITDNNFYA